MSNLTINSRSVDAEVGQTILDAARSHGIEIPTLCHHADLSPVGSCRLCLVEIEGVEHLVPACKQTVESGLRVLTMSPRVIEARRMVLRLLLANYHESPAEQYGSPETEFEHWLRLYDVRSVATAQDPLPHVVDSDANPFIRVDLNKCILCTRCVRACAEVQGRFVWGVADRGHQSHIVAGAGTSLLDARCESCGACVAYCPTGALDDRASFGLGPPDRLVTTTCTYCGVGCQFDLNVRDDRIIRVTSNAAAPVNGMHLCVKGRYGFDFVHHPDRLLKPRVRREVLEGLPRPVGQPRGEWIEVDWDRALDTIASRLVTIHRESGPNAIGLLSSAKCSNEENYLTQKLARQVFGTNNIDHCARLCHSSTVSGLAMALGSGAMSNSMDDVTEQAAAFFVIGSNTTEQHPVFGSMLRQAVLQRGAKLVVADPRKIDLTEFAAIHLRHRPGTDVALLNGLMHIMLANGWQDDEFIRTRCENFEVFCQSLEAFAPDRVALLTGVSADDLHRAAELLSRQKPMAVIWAMGITQHTTGVMNVLALANLQLLLGNLGVPGGGVNPLRGQNNVQGACDMGALPNVLPGYQPVTELSVREKFRQAWELSSHSNVASAAFEIPATPGLTVTELVAAAGERRLRGLYIIGENPVLTDPDSQHVRRCFDAAEFVVLQEIFPSATSEYADVLLPGTSFAERSGTFTNTERRVQLFRQAIPPLGDSRPDWWIVAELAQRCLRMQDRTPVGRVAGWTYAGPAEILDEARSLTPSYAGISHSRLDRSDALQWPVPADDHPGTPILHVNRFPRGLGRFHVVDHLPPHEQPDSEFPFLLTTGRVLYHWHGGEMTRRSHGLRDVCPESLVEISPDDAARLGLADGDLIRLRSRRGEMQARALVTERVAPGIVFGNFHFPNSHNVNNLTVAALDPIAKIPEYKVCAVTLEALPLASPCAS
jgi:formate dehydrogenase alpha subunit